MVETPSNTAPKRNNFITPAGYRKLVDELNELTKKERPRIVEEVSAAARQGDRSENAEYQYGKKRLREIDRRVRFLTRRIDSARIIDPRDQPHGVVLFGATVTVRNEDDEKVKVYKLVGEDEIDTLRGKISWKSPVARGLFKAKKGDYVDIEVPAGTITLQVLDIKFDTID